MPPVPRSCIRHPPPDELVTRALLRTSVRAAPYHAGLSPGIRRPCCARSSRGRSASSSRPAPSGWGFDKPDVRQSIALGPATLEAYSRRRAGRADGHPSECLVLWRREDLSWGNVDPA